MKIVAFAYSCEPGEGSEPGAGWMWSRLLGRVGETWVITRSNNKERIDRHLASIPERDRIHFEYVDLPEWARRWKKGTRGLRLYYPLWQLAALSRARKLARSHHFTIAWHLTLANVWTGTTAAFVGDSFVYGPVGGGVPGSFRSWRALGWKGVRAELARSAVRTAARYVNPLARLGWRRARTILVQNPETREWLPRRHRHKAVVLPHVIFDGEPVRERTPPGGAPGRALLAARLLPWKGAALAIEAVAALPGWTLDICGTGPDEARLRRLADRHGVADRVTFHGWVERNVVLSLMGEASVFVLPSMHDEAGWVVVEALAGGLPVVCLARGGPPLLGGTPVPLAGHRETVARLAEAMSGARGRAAESPPRLEDVLRKVRAAVPVLGGGDDRA
ncbi:MAG TPA: glycosyltransferase [Actinomycetota bacterium]|nr:glycosyltransferase [Actinomycetota bacterium]